MESRHLPMVKRLLLQREDGVDCSDPLFDYRVHWDPLAPLPRDLRGSGGFRLAYIWRQPLRAVAGETATSRVGRPRRLGFVAAQLLRPTPRLSNCSAAIVSATMNTSITANATPTDTSLMPNTP